MISTIGGFGAIILVGYALGCVKIAILYLLCIVPLRMYTGGYHANTYFVCNVVFALIFCGNIFLYKIIVSWRMEWFILAVSIFSIISILKYVPIENQNKKLTDTQRIKYKKISLVLYLFYYFVSTILTQLESKFGVPILLVLNTVSILVLEVKIVEKIKSSNGKEYC